MSNFDEKLIKTVVEVYDHDSGVDNAIDQIKQLISETLGEDEDESEEGKSNMEIVDIFYRNECRKELRRAFNLNGE